MGLLDDVVNQVKSQMGSAASGAHPDLVSNVVQMLGGAGGLSGLVQQFQQGGLGHIVQSWVANGPNLPITAQQVQQVLGNPQIQALASKLGISPQAVSQQLTQVLPHIVDRMTPGGQLPTGDALGAAAAALKKLI